MKTKRNCLKARIFYLKIFFQLKIWHTHKCTYLILYWNGRFYIAVVSIDVQQIFIVKENIHIMQCN